MSPNPWWYINQSSTLIGERAGITVVCTGGWFDVYLGQRHATGTMNLHIAFAYLAL